MTVNMAMAMCKTERLTKTQARTAITKWSQSRKPHQQIQILQLTIWHQNFGIWFFLKIWNRVPKAQNLTISGVVFSVFDFRVREKARFPKVAAKSSLVRFEVVRVVVVIVLISWLPWLCACLCLCLPFCLPCHLSDCNDILVLWTGSGI